MLSPLQPDVALLHAPIADRAGNVALHPPLLEGVWGALGARRGAIVTVERIVDDIRPWSHLVRIPAHRVLAVVECPMGAHPGRLLRGLAAGEGYGEDYEFWVEARAATRSDDYDEWIRRWVLEVETQEQWLDRLGADASRRARRRPRPIRGTPTSRSSRPISSAGERLGTGGGVGRALPRRPGRRARGRRGARGCGRCEPLGVARCAARA